MEGHERLSRLFSGNLPAMFFFSFRSILKIMLGWFSIEVGQNIALGCSSSEENS